MTPELRLVALACRPPRGEDRRALIAAAANEIRDWAEVRRLAAAHRVEGLVAHSVSAASPKLTADVALRFQQVAERVKAQAFKDLAETLRVARAVEGAGVPTCFLKGVPLGIRAFGTPALKQSWDIDLLVPAADAVRAASVLTGLGYGPYLPPRPLDEAEFRRWSAVSKEAELRSPRGGTVELHWGLSDHPMLLEGLGLADAKTRVELIGGASVATLNDAPNLAYLAVHGASHGWSRLKWLADFAAFLEARPVEEQRALIGEARRWTVGRSIDQALLLSDRLLATRFEPEPGDAAVGELARLAEVAIARRGEAADVDSDPVAQSAIQSARRMLVDSGRYRRQLAYRTLRGTEDRRHFPLPPALSWIYWLIRPVTATWRTARRRLKW